jgi:chitin synthase
MEDYLRAADQDELKRKREFAARAGYSEPDSYSPYSRPSILLDAASSMGEEVSPFNAPPRPYNHPAYAASASTAALPLVAPDPFAMEDDRRTFMTDDEFGKSRLDLEEGGPSSPGYVTMQELEKGEKGLLGGDAAAVVGEKETVEVFKETRARKQWKFLVWCFTWWIPSFLLIWPGKMKRPDVRMAWREKVTIFMLITLLCASAVFIIAILGNLLCPKQYVFSPAELSSHAFSNNPDDMLINIRGEVFDLTNFANRHYPSIIPVRNVQKYGGVDASGLFPVQVSALCNGKDGSISPWVTLDTSNTSDNNAGYHDFRACKLSFSLSSDGSQNG